MIRKHAKRFMITLMITALVALPMYGCGAGTSAGTDAATDKAPDEPGQGATQEASADAAATAPASAADHGGEDPEILETISGMSTQEKLAQMMIVSLRSDVSNTKIATEISQDYAEVLSKYDFGGIILFT